MGFRFVLVISPFKEEILSESFTVTGIEPPQMECRTL